MGRSDTAESVRCGAGASARSPSTAANDRSSRRPTIASGAGQRNRKRFHARKVPECRLPSCRTWKGMGISSINSEDSSAAPAGRTSAMVIRTRVGLSCWCCLPLAAPGASRALLHYRRCRAIPHRGHQALRSFSVLSATAGPGHWPQCPRTTLDRKIHHNLKWGATKGDGAARLRRPRAAVLPRLLGITESPDRGRVVRACRESYTGGIYAGRC